GSRGTLTMGGPNLARGFRGNLPVARRAAIKTTSLSRILWSTTHIVRKFYDGISPLRSSARGSFGLVSCTCGSPCVLHRFDRNPRHTTAKPFVVFQVLDKR